MPTGEVVSLTSALDGVGVQHHAQATLSPGNRPSTYCTGGWVGPRASLNGYRKSQPLTSIQSTLIICMHNTTGQYYPRSVAVHQQMAHLCPQ